MDRFELAFLGHSWLFFLRHAALNSRAEACWTEVKPSRVGRVEGVQIGHPEVIAGNRAQWRWGTLTGCSTAHSLTTVSYSMVSRGRGTEVLSWHRAPYDLGSISPRPPPVCLVLSGSHWLSGDRGVSLFIQATPSALGALFFPFILTLAWGPGPSNRAVSCISRCRGIRIADGPESASRYGSSALARRVSSMSLMWDPIRVRATGRFAEEPNPVTWSVDTRPR